MRDNFIRDGDFDTMGIKISVPTFCSKHSKAITFRTFRKKAPSQIGLRSDQRWCLFWGRNLEHWPQDLFSNHDLTHTLKFQWHMLRHCPQNQ